MSYETAHSCGESEWLTQSRLCKTIRRSRDGSSTWRAKQTLKRTQRHLIAFSNRLRSRFQLRFPVLIHPRSHLLHKATNNFKDMCCFCFSVFLLQMHGGVPPKVHHCRQSSVGNFKKSAVFRLPFRGVFSPARVNFRKQHS